MFEDSLFSSQRQTITLRKRWITIASIGIQLAIAATILLIPLLSTQSLPRLATAPAIVVLQHPRTPPKPPVPVRVVATSSNSFRVPSVEHLANPTTGRAPAAPDEAPPSLLTMSGPPMGSGPGLPTGIGTAGIGAGIHVVSSGTGNKTDAGLMHISSGVTSGMLIEPIKPIYPTIARTTHTQGAVVLTAIIDKTGRITRLQVMSGSPLLQNAALDAVRLAHYRPFLLNGEPTEVETTITINFRMES